MTSNLWRDGAVMLGNQHGRVRDGLVHETSFYGPVIGPWRAVGSTQTSCPAAPPAAPPPPSRWLCAAATATDAAAPSASRRAHRHRRHQADLWRCSRWASSPSPPRSIGPAPSPAPSDAAIMLGRCPADPKVRPASTSRCPISPPPSNGVRGLTIGIPREYRMDGMPAEIRRSGSRASPG